MELCNLLPQLQPRFWTTLHLLRPGIISGPCFERFEEWFKCGSRKKGAESENIFGNIEYRAIEPMLHCEQMHRYRKLIKQLLMNTIILKGTRHEMRMGPSTTISEKMIFVRPAQLPSLVSQRVQQSTRSMYVCQGGEHVRTQEGSTAGRYQ